MKRAVAKHEQSALAIQYLLLKKLTESGDIHAADDNRSYFETENRALEKNNHVEFQRKIKKPQESCRKWL